MLVTFFFFYQIQHLQLCLGHSCLIEMSGSVTAVLVDTDILRVVEIL